MVTLAKITIRGTVQGVGFRPYVFKKAQACNLNGYVANTPAGVDIEVEGEGAGAFVEILKKDAPPLSSIDEASVAILPPHGYSDFSIRDSITGPLPFTPLSPDISVCDDCLRELLDANDRRYLYPFINCTNCGPRYSIIKSIPYDRKNTTMSKFPMCEDCRREYLDPGNRRFHAEPIACERCGPALSLVLLNHKYSVDSGEPPINSVIGLLKQGAVVAVKGIGGFHLVCNALDDDAVNTLRKRKHRPYKPFAMMAASVDSIMEFAHVSEKEAALLQSASRPIVLLSKKDSKISPRLSGRISLHGFMLAYTPLHYLLFYHPSGAGLPHFKSLVMTSGNYSGEPIVTGNNEAIGKLSSVADAVLLNDRDIHMGCDDSVLRVRGDGTTVFIRRSRGYVAGALPLEDDGPEVAAYGGDLKNTFTLLKGRSAIPSPYHGDMENLDTAEFFDRNLKNMSSIYGVKPAIVACDDHPGFTSRSIALEREEGDTVKTVSIQHHHAHALSVMAEHGLTSEVVAVVLDGTGYGTDGAIWGGEFLIATPGGFKRAGHFKYVPLPGGERAIGEPRRMAVSYIDAAYGDGAGDMLEMLGLTERHGKDFIEAIVKILHIRECSPLSSSAGRLFDAVSSIVGLTDINTYEGQAPMELESIIAPVVDGTYPFGVSDDSVVDFSPTIRAIVSDMIDGVDRGEIAAMFHNTVVEAVVDIIQKISKFKDVILSGGVFQNIYLLDNTIRRLKALDLNVYTNEKVPSNDGGISLGQAYGARKAELT